MPSAYPASKYTFVAAERHVRDHFKRDCFILKDNVRKGLTLLC